MARRYYRRSIKAKANYSRENSGLRVSLTASDLHNNVYQNGAVIVPPSTVQGTRTVSNFTVTIPTHGSDSTAVGNSDIWWALVYVPQGTNANYLFQTTGNYDGSIYEPNQHVIATGMTDDRAGPIRIRTRMSRKLHSGDFVSLILGSRTTMNAVGVVSYSVKYN